MNSLNGKQKLLFYMKCNMFATSIKCNNNQTKTKLKKKIVATCATLSPKGGKTVHTTPDSKTFSHQRQASALANNFK